MGIPFVSSQADLARDERNAKHGVGNSFPVPRYSKFTGPAWDDAFRAAELLLKDSVVPAASQGKHIVGEAQDNELLTTQYAELSLNDLVAELEAAEKDSVSPFQCEGFREAMNGRAGSRQAKMDYGLKTETPPNSEVSDVVLSAREAQWGYKVVLKDSSRDSTPRTSIGSGSSWGCSTEMFGYSRVIPGVSAEVRDALSSFQLAFLVSDATCDDYPILYASPGFTTMTGYTADEVSGKNCRFLQGVDTDMAEVARVRDALKNGRIYSGSLLNYKKDGTSFWNLLTISPIKDDQGKVIKYIGMQAEQKSAAKLCKPLKGQKLRDGNTPTAVEVEKPALGPAAKRRTLGGSLPKPPVNPQKIPAVAQRDSEAKSRSSFTGVDSQNVPSQTTSRRYSLTLSAQSSDDGCGRDSFSPKGAMEARSDSHGAAAGGESDPPKSKTNRRSSRIFRLFRKTSASSRSSQDTCPTSRDDSDLSDSDAWEESARNRRRGSSLNPRAATSSEWRQGLAASVDTIRDKLNERMESTTSPSSDGEKKQFCIVHT
uniref:Putative LOV domain-containing protein n=1 Tax=Pallavicinia lyellii TaxID=56939 RepID=A0A126X408_PALLY|nr:putative LOV domain-containing protein [Pallavicinia lyellii]